MYSGDQYQSVANDAIAQLDRLAEQRLTPARLKFLKRTFQQATQLEADFWQMGLTLAT